MSAPKRGARLTLGLGRTDPVARETRGEPVQPASSTSLLTPRRRPIAALGLLIGLLALIGLGVLAYRHRQANHHLQLAQQALQRDDLDLAKDHLDRCLAIRDGDVAVYVLAAQVARRRDAIDEADAYLTAAERLPADAAVELERELLIAQQGEPDAVLGHLKSVMARAPDQSVPILEAFGKGYFNSFVRSDAQACFTMLL